MSDVRDEARKIFVLPKGVILLLEDMSKNCSQEKSIVVKVSIQFLYFMLNKLSEGYVIQLRHRETGEIVELPISI